MQSPLRELAPALAGQSLRVLVWDRDLVDMWSLDAAGQRTPYRGQGSNWHVHADLELTTITAGSGVLYVGDHIGRFAAPDCILLGADVPHVWKSDGAMAGVALQFRPDATPGLASLPECAALERLWAAAGFGLRWQGATAATLRAQVLELEGRSALERLGRFIAIAATMLAGVADDAQQLSG
nr:AraC family ligand binding domain-containing protein [Planctomycetota bacterium]